MDEPTPPDAPAVVSPTADLTPTGALALLGRFGSLVRAAHKKAAPAQREALESAFPDSIMDL